MTKRQGRIIPHGVSLEKHENDIIVVFTNLGCDVELIPLSYQKGVKTADAIIDGIEWEFKSPKGQSTRSIEHILKKAAKQSENIICDLRRMRLPQAACINKLKFEFQKRKNIKRLKIITKNNKVIDLNKKL